MQAADIWQELGEWITANKPQFGPGTKERFEMASKLTPEEVSFHASLHTDLYGTRGPLSSPPSSVPLPPCYVLHCRSLHYRAK
jgi:amidase